MAWAQPQRAAAAVAVLVVAAACPADWVVCMAVVQVRNGSHVPAHPMLLVGTCQPVCLPGAMSGVDACLLKSGLVLVSSLPTFLLAGGYISATAANKQGGGGACR
jgi:hypothetical protein